MDFVMYFRIISDDVEHEDEHESVKELREDPNYHPPVKLEQCFAVSIFTLLNRNRNLEFACECDKLMS